MKSQKSDINESYINRQKKKKLKYLSEEKLDHIFKELNSLEQTSGYQNACANYKIS